MAFQLRALARRRTDESLPLVERPPAANAGLGGSAWWRLTEHCTSGQHERFAACHGYQVHPAIAGGFVDGTQVLAGAVVHCERPEHEPTVSALKLDAHQHRHVGCRGRPLRLIVLKLEPYEIGT